MGLEKWLEPVSDEDPCGPNLEYDPDFLQLEESVRVQPNQEFLRSDGAAIQVEGGEVKWPQVREQAQALLARSKDLRLAVHLTRALLHTEGYGGIAQGLELIRRLLEVHWEAVHPGLDEEDRDPTMRLNALASLNAVDAVVGDLRASYLLNSRQQGQLTVRDLEVAQGRLSAPEGEAQLSPAQVDGLIAAAVKLLPELAAQAREAHSHLNAIVALLADKVGSDQVPDLSQLQAMLQLVAQSIAKAAPSAVISDTPESGSEIADVDGHQLSREGPAIPVVGQINSREDVVETLVRLCEYLERREPSNPVQILLRRAQRMMNMNFLELMQELAPDGLGQAEKVVGERLSKDDS